MTIMILNNIKLQPRRLTSNGEYGKNTYHKNQFQNKKSPIPENYKFISQYIYNIKNSSVNSLVYSFRDF